MKNIFFLTIFLLLAASLKGQDIQSDLLKSKADTAYINRDYATAIQLYDSLLNVGESAELYYNLGNSYYKSDNLAKAILNYERALLLRPDNEDFRANLEIARAKTIDKVVAIPEIFFIAWGKSLINILSIDAWAKLSIVCFWLFLIAIFLYFFTNQIRTKKIGFWAGLLFLTLVLLSNLFASQQKAALLNRNEAIVLSPSVVVRSTPSDTGTSLFILHEGRKVKIKDDSMKEWKEINLEDGKVGWVSSSSIERI